MNLKKLFSLLICLTLVLTGCGKKEEKEEETVVPKEAYTVEISQVNDYEKVEGGYPGFFFNVEVFTNSNELLDQSRIKKIHVEMFDDQHRKVVTVTSKDSLIERFANKEFPITDSRYSWSGYANLDSVPKQSSSWSHTFADIDGEVHVVMATVAVTLDNGVVIRDETRADVTRTLK